MEHNRPLESPEPRHDAPVHVVGIGASAGGIKALKEFFAQVQPESGAAYAVILHLSPDHDSRLAEVLQTTTAIPVTKVTAEVPLARNHVYVIPPNKTLEISDGALRVTDVTRFEQRKAPVDLFFRMLADSYGARAVCVVLSGTGPNGSAGLKRVKEHGGLALVQNPEEAEFGDMPRNSIATGLVDFVLPVAEIPDAIAAYFARLGQQEEEPVAAGTGNDPEAMRDVLTLMRVRTGHDFSNYKAATLQRRVERRINLRGVPTLESYARLIRQEPDEAVALMKELLISVTNFFRDADAWAVLEERIVPRLFLKKGSHDQVRVWVAGCATGEEAYSMAMLLQSYAVQTVDPPLIQVFGTDLDEQAIATAREGRYSEAEVADVPDDRLARYFHRDGGGYRVRRELRETVLFAHHNVIKDPPFSHLDLISCRNLMIYLNRDIQERVSETFHFALRPGGFLFLGTSESPDSAGDLFMRAEGAAHIYQSRTATSRLALAAADTTLNSARPLARAPHARPVERVLPPHLHQRLLEEYAPPSLVATEDYNVVHMSDTVGRYLQVPAGEPSRELLALVRSELRPDLRTALHRAAKERRAVEVDGIPVSLADGAYRVNIAVRPVLTEDDPARGFFLVMFTEAEAEPVAEKPVVTARSPAEAQTYQLEDDLARVRAQLRATVEQYEMQAEEARASNEELQAMNEELRSAAEELETSKEELQSLNEELTTVNQELKIKIDELGSMNNDFQNFINATDIGSIFLDRSLRVKFSTPRAQEIFNLLDKDIGRPLTDITSRLRYDRIHHDVRAVLDRLQTVEREVEADDGRWYLMRLLPYRTADNRIDGVVVTFHDVTASRQAEQQVRQSEERMRLLIDGAIDYAIFTVSEDGHINSWNPGAERMFGYASDEAIGARTEILFTREDRAAGVPLKELHQARHTGRAADERFHVRKNGTQFYSSGVLARLGGGGLGFVKIARDLTLQREAAEELRTAHDALEERVRVRTRELEAEVRDHEAAKLEVTSLLRKLVTAQESERARIARDLHDQLGQQLTALRLALERHNARFHDESEDPDVGEALRLMQQIGRDIDFLAWELRPSALDELGLVAALPRFVREWSAHVGITAEMRFGGFESGQLPHDAEVAFYRVVQEALNNVAKHAHASRVDVVLASSDGQVVLVVEDDGIGFDASDRAVIVKGVGLPGMRERAALVGAALHVESAPGKGTSVYLRRPIEPARKAR